MKKRVYLDYASLSPVDSRLFPIIKKYSSSIYGNPSSITNEGVLAKKTLDNARREISNFLGSRTDEIFFTSGGTESNNLAVRGLVEKLHSKGRDYKDMAVMISSIEHSSIIECAEYLKRLGVEIITIPVSSKGIVDLNFIRDNLKEKVVLVSVMYVNNEIGTVQPIVQIAKIIRKKGGLQTYFHTDASQAILYQDMNVISLGVDMLTMDAHKIYGPRAVGALYIKRGIEIKPIIYGGAQERGLRSGTENLPGIMAFVQALKLNNFKEKLKETKRLSVLKEYCFIGLKKIFKDISINGDEEKCSPHILSVNIPSIDAEVTVLRLDAHGISISTKSSCLRDQNESYVLKAIGVSSTNTLRISFGKYTKKEDINTFLKIIKRLNDKGLLKGALAQNV